MINQKHYSIECLCTYASTCDKLRQQTLVFACTAASSGCGCSSADTGGRRLLLVIAPMIPVVRLVQLLDGTRQRMGERLVFGHVALNGFRMTRGGR